MKFWEALREAQDNGKKIRRPGWEDSDDYLFWEDEKLCASWSPGALWDWELLVNATDLEIYEESITWYRVKAHWWMGAWVSGGSTWCRSEDEAKAGAGYKHDLIIMETMEAPDHKGET